MASRRWGRQRKACGPPACPAAPKHSSTGRRSTGGPQPEFSLEFRTGGVAGPRGLGVVRTLDFLRVLIGCFSILSKYLAQHLWNPSPHCFPRETPSCPRSGPQAPTALAPGLTLQLPPPQPGGRGFPDSVPGTPPADAHAAALPAALAFLRCRQQTPRLQLWHGTQGKCAWRGT